MLDIFMQHKKAAPFVAAFLFLVIGCAPKRSGILDYDALRHAPGSHFTGVYVAERAPICDITVLVVPPVRLAGAPKHADTWRAYAERVHRQVTRFLIRSKLFRIVTTDEAFLRYPVKDGIAARLDLYLTELDKGNGLLRYIAGAGAGATRLTIEGKLTSANGQTLAEFLDTRVNNGHPNSGLNPGALYADRCLDESIEQFALELTAFFDDYHE